MTQVCGGYDDKTDSGENPDARTDVTFFEALKFLKIMFINWEHLSQKRKPRCYLGQIIKGRATTVGTSGSRLTGPCRAMSKVATWNRRFRIFSKDIGLFLLYVFIFMKVGSRTEVKIGLFLDYFQTFVWGQCTALRITAFSLKPRHKKSRQKAGFFTYGLTNLLGAQRADAGFGKF